MIKAFFRTRPLIDWLRDIPDPRSSRSKPHELTEIFVCIIMGLLAGKTKLRRIVRWSKRHLTELRRHMPFPNGVPSVSTMSRMLAAVDEEMVSLALINWIGEVLNTRGIHIAIDGKGLRAAARKVRGERTPYILNAIDTASRLVIGQLVIHGKANEMTAVPELVELLEFEGSTITIDAIGATENIMNAIRDNGGEFVLQVKKNCPELYAELMRLFEGLSEDREHNPEEFQDKYGNCYSEAKTAEKNRERYEYRFIQSYSNPGGIQESRPHIAGVGRTKQVRIMQIQDDCGNDITPYLTEFLEEGSKKQPKRMAAEGMEYDAEWSGLAASKVLDAEEMLAYKRKHWAIESCLHYVLDETFGEDKSTIKLGKNTMSLLRKCAYNIARLLQMEKPEGQGGIPDIIDDICDNLEIGFQMIFSPIPSRY